ncbi:predicted protein [Thalassiosira pseudonana CCMP1335]|uniref:Isochorismatase-like domain-containing protein n=1 Tax=Thalassiosira pseudonana TaxID=35128 RepID=B8C0U7_THAPS|nr:predicted protein [Thalassiosira pseudonana CCMP1335]EED92665.1 predicted protein [Thalassiosira pseudonana CCMP1335]
MTPSSSFPLSVITALFLFAATPTLAFTFPLISSPTSTRCGTARSSGGGGGMDAYAAALAASSKSPPPPQTTPSPPQLKLDPSETALVLIEYQNEFAAPNGKLYSAVQACIEHTNMLHNSYNLMTSMRNAGCHIMHVPIIFDEGHAQIGATSGILKGIQDGKTFERNSAGAQFYETMQPVQGDMIVSGKLGLCGFFSTNLDFLLRQKQIKNVVLGGFLTNCCIESTMRTAYECGYEVYTVKDCTAATSVEAHEMVYEHSFPMFSTVVDSEEMRKAVV